MSYLGRVVLAVLVVMLAWSFWQVRQAVIPVFGGLVFAIVLLALSRPLARVPHVSDRGALAVVIVALVIGVGGVIWWTGDAVIRQWDQLRDALPSAVRSVGRWLETVPLGQRVLDVWADVAEEAMGYQRVLTAASRTLAAIAGVVLVFVIGVFLAAEPRLYVNGAARLFPPPLRQRVRDALTACADALEAWLKGQAVSMTFIGVTTWAGLALLGVPLAFILGLLAGILEFIPFLGPVVAGGLAVLFAFAEDPRLALYVVLLAIAIQQMENHLLVPLVQRWAVHLPPVLAVTSILVFGGLFGMAGVLFATPMMVVLMVLVRRLYIEQYLESEQDGRN